MKDENASPHPSEFLHGEDNYVYISVKLYLKPGQTEDSIHEIVQEMDYSFVEDNIVDHEIVDIIDFHAE